MPNDYWKLLSAFVCEFKWQSRWRTRKEAVRQNGKGKKMTGSIRYHCQVEHDWEQKQSSFVERMVSVRLVQKARTWSMPFKVGSPSFDSGPWRNWEYKKNSAKLKRPFYRKHKRNYVPMSPVGVQQSELRIIAHVSYFPYRSLLGLDPFYWVINTRTTPWCT